MKPCIETQSTTANITKTINNISIDIEQRLLSRSEVIQYQNMFNKLKSNKDIYSALYDEDKKKKISNFDKMQAELQSEMVLNEASNLLIISSMTPNMFYGGYCKINGKQATEKEMKDFLSCITTEVYSELFTNAINLSFTKKEEEEAGKP